MEKTYSLKEIEKAFDVTIECLENAMKLADKTDDETPEEQKEIVEYITISTAKLLRKQVLSRLKGPDEELLNRLFELLR